MLLISGAANIALDLALGWGVPGAAAATAVAQLLSAGMILWSLSREGRLNEF